MRPQWELGTDSTQSPAVTGPGRPQVQSAAPRLVGDQVGASPAYDSRPRTPQDGEVSCVTCKYIVTMPFTKSQHWRQDHIYQTIFILFTPDCFCH